MGLKELFKKKKMDFMEMLQNQTDKTAETMSALFDFIKSPDKEKAEKVEKLEEEADELRRILIDELNRSFVTPIDREDLFALSRAVDDMADYAKSTVEEVLLFEIVPDQYLYKIAEALCNASKEISLAVKCLRTHPGVCQEHIVRAKKTENFVEHRYREGLVELFKDSNFNKIFKVREIYRHLSNAADKVDEAANIIANVLVKTT